MVKLMVLSNYRKEYLNTIREIDFFSAVQIEYHNGVLDENVVCVTRDGNVIGVGFLILHKTLQSRELKITFSIEVEQGLLEKQMVSNLLMDGLLKRFHELKKEYPDNRTYLRICFDTEEVEEMQFFLEKGFCISSAIPVLKYDLTKETIHYNLPSNVQIIKHDFNDNGMKQYLKADYLASAEFDSEADLCFHLGDPNFSCYTAICENEIVGAISVWNISDERAATENIFVTPAYRRQNIARELISQAFDVLKERDMKIATLSVIGSNVNAIKLYLSCGYSLYYNLIEMVYE